MIFDRLEKLVPNLSRDDELYKIVLEFAIIHNDIYLQKGILIGFEIYRTFEQEYKELASDNIYSMIKEQVKIV